MKITFGRAAALSGLAALAISVGLNAAPPAPKRIKSTDEFQVHDTPRIDPETAPGRPLWEQNCAICHLGGVPKAPSPAFLGMLAPDAIVTALTSGVMKAQGATLSAEQKVQVAEYLTRTPYASYQRPAPPPRCEGAAAQFDMSDPPAAIGWGHDNRRFVPAGIAGLAKADVPKLKLKWAFAYPAANRARSQPTLGWGTLFVGSQDGTVYAFDPESGCTKWTTRLSAEVRTAIVADAATKRLYFGDLLGKVHALDAMTGQEIWAERMSDHADATITGTPTLGGGMLYVPVSSLEVVQPGNPKYACCSFRGSVVALNPETGKEAWRAWTSGEPKPQGTTAEGAQILGPSGAPVWNSPTYDAKTNRVYFGSGENYSTPADDNSDAVFAVDAKTGLRVWHTQLTMGDAWNVGCMIGLGSCPKENGPDYDVAASPLMIDTGGGARTLVIGQKSGQAWGLDPDTGKIRWETRVGHGGTQGGVHFGMAAEGTRVFVPVNDMADTYDGRVYDEKQRGAGLHALDAVTGKELWFARAPDLCRGRRFCDPGISSAVTAIPGVAFGGHLDGMLRAYDADNGNILWQVDTTQPVRTIDGTMVGGGSMSGPGAAVWQGKVFVNSGYGMYSHMAGKAVLLVYEAAK
ncbi:outer membrane protein assembly factor BamB family protein [Novosphingobium cyanobacteriorum]|uniref:PQQ-binding-like beta-propeller repeat protein n=1 Tax=Novosphingobium cyanobacteriorum TaxID=3024215 RepID=A0ABT6CLH9_9SPHN|nr:PQQ-binding-like beta-propeller repeat protein [Novosphingobium cyanobacteriorum]MDF8334651.1 PQQ-binding-like beta-propeller repeat protein [Novosphingobium cyanobacteriorum]